MIPIDIPADQWDDLALGVAAILTAIAGVVTAVFAIVKWQREFHALRAELSPTTAPAAESPPAQPAAAATTRDVVDQSHVLLLQIAGQVEGLIAKDNEIKKWGESEHTRLDGRIDELAEEIGFQHQEHEERLSRLEKGAINAQP